jgi:dTDP-4-amino-4,6-dideoxygalactose transaminase
MKGIMHDPDDLPAILGGPPVFPDGPPAWPPAWREVKAALDAAVADGSWGQYHGPHVRRLEEKLCEKFDRPHALTCASGTLAVEVALRAVGVGPGNEVILAAYEYEGNFHTIHAIGAKPVLVDVSAADWQLDPNLLAPAVSPATKAILCSHIHGGQVAVDAVMAVADRHGIPVVEDAAQFPTGDFWEEFEMVRPTGEGRPHVTTLSFGGSKLLTAGRGGAMVFREPKHFQRAKVYLGRGPQQWAALSELQAAVLLPQLDRYTHVPRFLAVAAVVFQMDHTDRYTTWLRLTGRCSGYKTGFRLDPAAFGLSREQFVAALRAEGVAFDPGFKALHLGRSPSRFRAAGDLPNATDAHHHCVILHHPVLLGGGPAGIQVARAITRTYRNADRIRAALP